MVCHRLDSIFLVVQDLQRRSSLAHWYGLAYELDFFVAFLFGRKEIPDRAKASLQKLWP